MERWRVEDLARRAEVSVDTIRFYQKRRLLAPPAREGRVAWYGPEHLERLARIRELQGQGLTLALIERLLAGEIDATDVPLAAAVASAAADTGRAKSSSRCPSSRHAPGSRSPSSKRSRAKGCSCRASTTARSATRLPTSRSCNRVCRLLERGLPLPELLALAREHTAATRDVAEQAVALFDEHVRQPLRTSDLPDDEKAEQLVAAFRVLLPTITTLVAHHFRRVLLAVAQEHLERVGEDTELAAVVRSRGRPARRGVPLVKTDASAALPASADKAQVVEDMFDRIAPRYDLLNRLLTFRMDVGWRRTAVRELELAPGSVVLDVACGTGDLCRELGQNGLRPIGVDFSAGMLASATVAAPLVRGDALRLPFPTGSIDGLISGFALRNFTGLEPFFVECARVLRPRGTHRAPRRRRTGIAAGAAPCTGCGSARWCRSSADSCRIAGHMPISPRPLRTCRRPRSSR